jgi:hypothetical protein
MDQNNSEREGMRAASQTGVGGSTSYGGTSSGQSGTGSGAYRAPSSPRAGSEAPWDEESRTAARAAEEAKRLAERTSEVASQSMDRAVAFFRENPGTLALVSLGAGIGIGLLIANGGFSTRSARTARYAEPLVNAISGIALEFLRGR